jgi:hypothetical protein
MTAKFHRLFPNSFSKSIRREEKELSSIISSNKLKELPSFTDDLRRKTAAEA